jgi:hypothetical protein
MRSRRAVCVSLLVILVVLIFNLPGIVLAEDSTSKHGYGKADFYVGGGIMTPGITDEDLHSFWGFGSGMVLQFGARYFPPIKPFVWERIPDDDRRTWRYFLGISYSLSYPSYVQETYYYGLESDQEIHSSPELSIRHFMLEMGITSNIIRNDSYVYFYWGVGSLSCDYSYSRYSDESYFSFRLGLGGVIGVSRNIGIVMNAMADVMLSNEEKEEPGLPMMLVVGLNVEI